MTNTTCITNYQAKYFAYKLTSLNKNGNLGGISQALMNAQVDLNPHQVEAASFAIKSPLSKGVILADEVGLGKTIEAGIVLCQYWAERKRHLIVICPAALREQWKSELEEKFNLKSIILDRKNYIPNIFSLTDKIIIVSYNFAAKMETDLHCTPWDLVVFDEAHKLRNVYKESNKTARIIEQALQERRKLLLTATPLQNSLMELYGLSMLIDRYTFGDEQSFKSQYCVTTKDHKALKERLSEFCKRTLRSQVNEYIKYTERKPITFPFVPSKEEQMLYENVSKFLQKESLYALPPRQRHLTSLILYKLLASSSNAIHGTFETMLERLNKLKEGQDTSKEDQSFDDLIDEAELEDEEGEIIDIDDVDTPAVNLEILNKEIEEVKRYVELSGSIKVDNKTIELLKALKVGFSKMDEMGAPRKALIFTESRRSQKYLTDYLSAHDFENKIVQFYGGNKAHRSELIEEFKNKAEIMIATEAGAEGLNMQFCSLLINYDLPWNPQRVEQRIGRCHRYGQKHDVVVINFVNKKNPADQRVFELLNEKFQLFEGVFGASDEILGSIEDGVDFERKILNIYQTCRTPEEIDQAFDSLQAEMQTMIDEKMKSTKQMLLTEFDADVHKRLKINLGETRIQLSEMQSLFWKLARSILSDDGIFDEDEYSFTLKNKKLGKPQKYYFITQNDKHTEIENSQILRLSHPIGEYLIQKAKEQDTSKIEEIMFDVSNSAEKHSFLEQMKKKHASGIGTLNFMTINSFEKEEYLVLSGLSDDGKILDQETMEEMIKLSAKTNKGKTGPFDETKITNVIKKDLENTKIRSENRNMQFFKDETEKIDRYTEDKLYAVEKELRDIKSKIKTLTREERIAENLERKMAIEEEISLLEKKKRRLRQNIFDVEDEIDLERKKLIDSLKKRLKSDIKVEELFKFRWKLV